MFLIGVFDFNPWIVIGAGLILLILSLVLIREKPVPDMWRAWATIREREAAESHTVLPLKPARMQAEPHGQYWIFQARVTDNTGPSIVSYFWQEIPGRVVGRRIRLIDDIKREMDKSDISKAVSTQALMRYERNKILEIAGYEPDDPEDTR